MRLACSNAASESALRIWMSIGDGAPKFRIWLMMSAGRNEKVKPGKRSGSRRRSSAT